MIRSYTHAHLQLIDIAVARILTDPTAYDATFTMLRRTLFHRKPKSIHRQMKKSYARVKAAAKKPIIIPQLEGDPNE